LNIKTQNYTFSKGEKPNFTPNTSKLPVLAAC